MRERTWTTWRAGVWGSLVSGALLAAVLFVPVRAGLSQVAPASQQGPPIGRPGFNNGPFTPPEPMAGPNPRRLEHMREDDRHKRLVADTEKLIQLTNELKADLDKTSKDELSLDVVRKAAEIEKLAHDVKERMKS